MRSRERAEEFVSYIHPDDRERVQGEVARALAERLPTYYIKYRFRRADGAVRWLEGFARLSTNGKGEPVSLLGVSHDVTEREELLEGEQQARRNAEAANAAKAIFLTTMSHELRTPLNAVAGYVDLLGMGVRGPITEAQGEDLRRIRRASQHLLSLINDILNYARLEAGSVELHLSDVTLAEALAGMEALIAPQLRAKGVAYEYLPCDRSLRVHADREKLDQILLNLVGNAVKFTERDGRITLSCSADNAHVRVIVEDTGRGIPRARLQSIFDPSCRSIAISRRSGSRVWGSGSRSVATSRARCTATSRWRATPGRGRRSCSALRDAQPMLWMMPPSARKLAPFVIAASGLATKATSTATSDGSANRLISDAGRVVSKYSFSASAIRDALLSSRRSSIHSVVVFRACVTREHRVHCDRGPHGQICESSRQPDTAVFVTP